MARIDVNLDTLDRHSADISAISDSLKTISSRIVDVQNSLYIESGAKDPLIRAMINIESGILKEAVTAKNFSQALVYICRNYRSTEKDISGNMSLFEKVMHFIDNATFDILNSLGLTEIYNDLKYKYEQFDNDRTQESLMDHYLQHKCFEIMQRPEYSEENWANATPTEREQIIRDFIRDVNIMLCTTSVITVIFDDGEGNTENNGYFDYHDDGTAVIYINPARLQTGDRAVFNTAIHESRHCYQHSAVDDPEGYLVSEETLDRWENNFKHYIDEGIEYYEQPVEWDTFNFAHQEDRVINANPEYRGSW